MYSPNKQKVLDKTRAHSVTANSDLSALPVLDNEEQSNTNVDEEQASRNLKIKKLNHDCLAQVLMHLSVLDRLEMEKVCKKWEEATKMSSYNFKKLNFNDLKIPLDKKEETWKEILNKYGRYLTDLTINYKYSWICDVINHKCDNLTHLNIDGDYKKACPKTLLETITYLSKLKYLKLELYTKKCPNFFCHLMRRLPDDIDEIHLIAADFDHNNTFPIITTMLEKFTNIRRLTLRGFRLYPSIMDLIILNNETLVYLDLSECDSLPDPSIFLELPNLEHVNLREIKNLNPNVISAIVSTSPKLTRFEWHGYNDRYTTQYLPYEFFHELKNLVNLEYLHLEGAVRADCHSSFLTEIANNCKKIKHLHTGLWTPLIVPDIKEIVKFKNLEYLNFGLLKINSESLIEIANNCLELRQAGMLLEDVDENAIEKLTNLKKLEILIFSNCDGLTGNVLIKIINSCKNLKDVRIMNCKNVTEASLIQVGKLEFLERLDIDKTVNVPIGMFDYFRNLKVLSCYNCPSVTDEGIIKVIDNCQNLCKLSLARTSVTVETLIHASKRQFVFQVLRITISKSDEINSFRKKTKSPYLILDIEPF